MNPTINLPLSDEQSYTFMQNEIRIENLKIQIQIQEYINHQIQVWREQ